MNHDKLSMQQLGRISVSEFKQADKTPIAIILDNIRSMNNIGSVFRTADAFCLQKVFLCGITAKPPHREINKTALGATESVDWQYYDNTIDCVKELQKQSYTIIALEQTQNSTMLQNFKITNLPLAIILGNEVEGVAQQVIDMCDDVIEIPQYGTKHSFNVSVSCGITLWELFKQIKNL